jgi:hypothetical protein
MPNKYDELEVRVTAVEHELRRVREDAAAARVLAREADRDVSVFGIKLDAHTKTLNALRETQLEMQSTQLEFGRRLTFLERKVEDGFARIGQEFALVNEGFVKVEEQFVKLGAGMAHIMALLERITESE